MSAAITLQFKIQTIDLSPARRYNFSDRKGGAAGHEHFADMRLCRKIQRQFHRISGIFQKKFSERRRLHGLCVSRQDVKAQQPMVYRPVKRDSDRDI